MARGVRPIRWQKPTSTMIEDLSIMIDTMNPKFNPEIRPATMKIREMNFPDEIKAYPQFVAWGWKWKGKKWDKPPLKAFGRGGSAKSTDPETWTSYEKALRYVKNFEYYISEAHRGLGFCFTEDDPFVGIDLDNCRDPQTGIFTDKAWQIICMLGSYAEISPSGTGVKIWIQGKMPEWSGKANHKEGVEVFESGKYYTLTGHQVPGTPKMVRRCQPELEWICRTYLDSGETKKKTKKKPSNRQNEPRRPTSAIDDREHVLSALDCLPASMADDYDDWLRVGMALHTFDQSLLGEWEQWSMQSPKYCPSACSEKWDSFTACDSGGVTVGTIFKFAQDNGWTFPQRVDPTVHSDIFENFQSPGNTPSNSEFFGEIHFHVDSLGKQESGSTEGHSNACVCDKCSAKARTAAHEWKYSKDKTCRTNHLLSNGEKVFYARVNCKSWTCPDCRKKILVPKWEKHLVKVANRYQKLYVGLVPHEDRAKISKQIRKQKGDFAQLNSDLTEIMFVSTVPFCGGQLHAQSHVVERIKKQMKILKDFPSRRKAKTCRERVITTSKKWTPRFEDKDSNFKRIDMPQANDVVVRKVAAEHQITIEPIRYHGNGEMSFARFHLPENFFGGHWDVLKSFAERVKDIMNPSDGASNSMSENNPIELDAPDDYWESLCAPLEGAPTGATDGWADI